VGTRRAEEQARREAESNFNPVCKLQHKQKSRQERILFHLPLQHCRILCHFILDEAIKKLLAKSTMKKYSELSEFLRNQKTATPETSGRVPKTQQKPQLSNSCLFRNIQM